MPHTGIYSINSVITEIRPATKDVYRLRNSGAWRAGKITCVSEKGKMFFRFRNSGVSAFQGLESQTIIYRTFVLQDDSDCTVALGAFDVATRRMSMSSRVIVRTISCLSLASCALASNPSHIDVQLDYSTHNIMRVLVSCALAVLLSLHAVVAS